MASSSSSGLTFKLHPRITTLVVFDCVIGVQSGRTVEIFNNFELLYDPATHSLDRAFLEKKQELYKKVFPNFYVLGWYSSGSDAQESDMLIHKAEYNDTLLVSYLAMFTNCSRYDV
uniref:COP9 signalosome complex subunit 6b n=1 Tax=Solanum tuberosum TaxID=4113 RepID=M1C035_SOLTU